MVLRFKMQKKDVRHVCCIYSMAVIDASKCTDPFREYCMNHFPFPFRVQRKGTDLKIQLRSPESQSIIDDSSLEQKYVQCICMLVMNMGVSRQHSGIQLSQSDPSYEKHQKHGVRTSKSGRQLRFYLKMVYG